MADGRKMILCYVGHSSAIRGTTPKDRSLNEVGTHSSRTSETVLAGKAALSLEEFSGAQVSFYLFFFVFFIILSVFTLLTLF